MHRLAATILALVSFLLAALPAAAESLKDLKFGVVLMHGKWGAPDNPALHKLSQALRDAGVLLEMPTMPWSRHRNYDAGYGDALKDIDKAVATLKEKGAARIAVGGHSFGANAAILYAANRDGVAGVIALAPGHVPDMGRFRQSMASDVQMAKQQAAAGKGGESFTFADLNQGRRLDKHATADIFLSYFDPEGMGAMTLSAPKIKSGAALLWVIGEKDPLFAGGKAAIYDKAPANSKSRYVEVPGGHMETPSESVDHVLGWFKALAQH